MKTLILLRLLIITILLTGCETQQLTLEEHAEEMAPSLGADASDLKFLSYCQFQLLDTSSDSVNPVKPGVLALSDSHFYLMTEAANRSQANYRITIPIQEMESISKCPSQFHLMHNGELMVFWLKEASSQALTQEKYETVYQLFSKNQVPEIAAVDEYRLPMHSWGKNNSPKRGGSYIPGVRLSGAYGATQNSRVNGTRATGIQ